MQSISFTQIDLPREKEDLLKFLTSEEWPFHVNCILSQEKVEKMFADGTFTGSNHESFWIQNQEQNNIGFIRLMDLDDVDDGYPLFDLRIQKAQRGNGIGIAAVGWLTTYLFQKFPQLERIAGATRADNAGMRKVFRRCG